MRAEENFIKKLEAFLDREFDKYSNSRIQMYLKEYRDEIPAVVIKKEVKPERTYEVKLPEPETKRDVVYKTYATPDDLIRDAKDLCALYKIDIDEFMNRKHAKARAHVVDVRKQFCSMSFERYFCSNDILAKFFKVHHSTISFYLYGKKYMIRPRTSQTLKLKKA